MKLFETGSATVVSDCQIFFRFLPATYQIDIRTANFLENLYQVTTVYVWYLSLISYQPHLLDVRQYPFSCRVETFYWRIIYSHLSIWDLLQILLLCYCFIITWYKTRYNLKPWTVVICTCSVFIFCCFYVCCRFWRI